MIPSANTATPSIGPTSAFAYAGSENTLLYQAVMRVFIESKERFVSRLSSQDVADAIQSAGQSEIESALAQLCEWGNLQIHSGAGQTFQMTPQGEAAVRALAYFSTAFEGEKFQCGIVTEIRCVLQELKQLSKQAELEASQIHRNLLVLWALFEEVSSTAQVFVEKLGGEFDSPSDARSLIDFGQRFIAELSLEADGICETVRDIEAAGFDRLLHGSHWRLRWDQIRTWFISQPGLPSRLEMLRERARTSMLAVLTAGIDRRTLRIDRAGDFRVLARWFAQAESDSEAHLLWRAAFGLCSARHLIINDATLDDREATEVSPNTSWLDSPPLQTSVQDYRTSSRTRGLSRIIDRSAEKEKLAAAGRGEAQRLLNAQRRFGPGNRIRLSELEHLETDEFELFLDLLGEAVSVGMFSAEPVEILSGDGGLRIKLEPTCDGRQALIPTTDGELSGPDHWISIEQISADDAQEVLM